MIIIATIEARMGSTRLPGKTLLPVVGRPMLEILLERIAPAAAPDGLIDRIVVATTRSPADDAIAELCAGLHVACYRGSENDVRNRVFGAAREHGADILVKLTGDNPLVHYDLVEAMLERFIASDCDLLTNGAMEYTTAWREPRTFPVGLNIQILKTTALAEAVFRFPDSDQKEHVTLDILAHPEIFRLCAFHAKGAFASLNQPKWRFTVDTPADLAFVRAVFDALYTEKQPFSLSKVADFLRQNPDVLALNAECIQHNPVKHP